MTSHKATCLPAAVASSPLLKKVIAFTCERSTRVAGEPWQRPIARPRCPERDGCSIAACGPQLPTGRRERQVPISAGNGGVESLPRSHAAARWRSRPSLHCPRRGQAARASSDRPRQPPLALGVVFKVFSTSCRARLWGPKNSERLDPAGHARLCLGVATLLGGPERLCVVLSSDSQPTLSNRPSGSGRNTSTCTL